MLWLEENAPKRVKNGFLGLLEGSHTHQLDNCSQLSSENNEEKENEEEYFLKF